MYVLFLAASSCFILLSSDFTSASPMVAGSDFAFSRKFRIRFSPNWRIEDGRQFHKIINIQVVSEIIRETCDPSSDLY